MKNFAIFSDFDGTICLPDSSEYLLSQFGTDRWLELDNDVWQGRLTEREAFPLQLETLNVDWPQARASLLQGVRIREGFSDFVTACRNWGIPLAVLSSGLRNLIDELLASAGVFDLPVFCHNVSIRNGKWRFIPYPGARLEEHCSHCKCVHLEQARAEGKTVIYIGDGYTDICPSRRADIIFATNSLAEKMTAEGRSFIRYHTFRDIEQELDTLIHKD